MNVTKSDPYLQITVTIGNGVKVDGTDEEGVARSADDRLSHDRRSDETIRILTNLVRGDRLREREEFALLGTCLFDKLFQGETRSFIRRRLEQAPEGAVLRLVLQFEHAADSVAHLPWEFLHVPPDVSPTRSGFVASMDELILSRRVNVDARFDPDDRPIRILVGIASPTHQIVQDKYSLQMPNSVDIGTLTDVLDELNQQSEDFRIEVVNNLTEKRLKDLVTSELKPHIIHLAAHGRYEKDGEKGYLALCSQDDPSLAHWVADDRLADTIQGRGAAVVFLHACSTARSESYVDFRGMALRLLERGVPAVVAMSFEIDVDTASKFAVEFYRGLAEGLPVDHAVQQGRRVVGMPDGSMANFQGRAFGCPVAFVQVPRGLVLAREAKTERSSEQPVPQQPTVLLNCPVCQWPVQETYRICPNIKCRARLKPCPSSGCRSMMQDGQYCSVCGYEESATTQPTTTASPSRTKVLADTVGEWP